MMENYICTMCGHVYNPNEGESLQNVPPGRDFSDMPDDWQCPIDGASQQQSVKE
jgi:rubredoxin